MNERRTVFLVDDHPLVREWLGALIAQQADLVICGDAGTAEEAMLAIRDLKPDAIVVDLSLPAVSGVELIKQIHVISPRSATLVLSMHDEASYAERALRAGARGYVRKKETTRSIITAIRTVLSGGIFVSDEFKDLMARRLALGDYDTTDMGELSDRELEVFRMLGQGKESKEIACTLQISVKTVQVYCTRIKDKLRVSNHTELLRRAILWWDSCQQ